MKKLDVIYCGTPDFSVPTLELLHNHPHINLKMVVSMPARPAGRGNTIKTPPVIEYCQQNKIPFLQTENINNEKAFLEEITKNKVDFILVLAFAQFLSKHLLSLPEIGCFNIHTSLLPKYRGASPIQHAILNGDAITGVTIQKMVSKMDAGKIVIQTPLSIGITETGAQLYTRLKFQSAITTNEFIKQVLDEELDYVKQDESQITFAPTLKKEDGLLDFFHKTSKENFNKIKAFNPWPSTYCFINEKRTKIIETDSSPLDLKPGEIKIFENKIHIGCLKGSIMPTLLQLEGKKACLPHEFINGLKDKENIKITSAPKGKN